MPRRRLIQNMTEIENPLASKGLSFRSAGDTYKQHPAKLSETFTPLVPQGFAKICHSCRWSNFPKKLKEKLKYLACLAPCSDPNLAAMDTKRTYDKQYTQQSIKLAGVNSKGRTALFYVFNFGKGNTFRRSTGLVVDPGQWTKKEGFAASFIKAQGKHFGKLLQELEAQQADIWNAYTLLCEVLDRKPTPQELAAHFEAPKASNVRTPFAEWIRDTVPTLRKADTHLPLAPLTQAKYLTTAPILEALEALRKGNAAFARLCKGRGPLYLETFSSNDYADYSLLLDMAGGAVGEQYTLYGIEGVDLSGGYYALTSKQKHQSTLIQLLRTAKRQGLSLSIDLDTVRKVVRGKPQRDYYLLPGEVAAILHYSTTDAAKENARQLLLLCIFLGCRYSDLHKVLAAPLTQYKGVPLVQYVSHKTNTKVCAPVFTPILSYLGKHRPTVIGNTYLNNLLKELCRDIGLDRQLHITAPMADGTLSERYSCLCDELSTHIGRRTAYSILAGHLSIDSILVTKALTGHRNAKEVHLQYDKLSAQDTAYRLWSKVQDAQGELPFAFV